VHVLGQGNYPDWHWSLTQRSWEVQWNCSTNWLACTNFFTLSLPHCKIHYMTCCLSSTVCGAAPYPCINHSLFFFLKVMQHKEREGWQYYCHMCVAWAGLLAVMHLYEYIHNWYICTVFMYVQWSTGVTHMLGQFAVPCLWCTT